MAAQMRASATAGLAATGREPKGELELISTLIAGVTGVAREGVAWISTLGLATAMARGVVGCAVEPWTLEVDTGGVATGLASAASDGPDGRADYKRPADPRILTASPGTGEFRGPV
jgi:hypothetical protein